MADDPMSVMRMLRQAAEAAHPDLAPVGVSSPPGMARLSNGMSVPLHGIPMRPGDPGWEAKLPPPAPLRVMNAAGGDAPPVPMEDVTAGVVMAPPAVAPPPSPKRRIAIYNGKGDTYNVAVESAPDWDTDKMFKGLDEERVRLLLDIASSLEVRTTDKTGDF